MCSTIWVKVVEITIVESNVLAVAGSFILLVVRNCQKFEIFSCFQANYSFL
jgi:hypothetical protein